MTKTDASDVQSKTMVGLRRLPTLRKKITMFSVRRSFRVATASVLLAAVASGEAASQTSNNPETKTPAELANAIAAAINTNIPKTPNVPIAFESAESRDNVVVVHYRANEKRVFPHNKAEADERRLRLAGYFCFDSRISLFRKSGVVVHQILTAPDDTAPFEFTLDQSTCASLIADATTRAKAAEQKRFESNSAIGPNSLAEPKRVPTIIIRPDQK